MDLNQTLRTIYYTPVPLIVLTPTRIIKLLNQPAEKLLGLQTDTCLNHWMERYVDHPYKAAFSSALNDATENLASSEPGKSIPITTRVSFCTSGNSAQSNFLADLTISAWFPTDPIPETIDPLRQYSNKDPSISPSATARAPHNALYTIAVTPATGISLPDTTLNPKESSDLTDYFKEAVFDHINEAVIAVSKDGKTQVRNRACDEILAHFPLRSSEDEKDEVKVDYDENDFMDVADRTMTCYGGDFVTPMLREDWPLYKCAVLGQSTPSSLCGLESKVTGARILTEITTSAIRDRGGYGQHIGGVICFRNITLERKKQKIEAEAQGDLHYKQIVNTMPVLVYHTSVSGFNNWYSPSFYEYTGASKQLLGAGWQEIIHPEDLTSTGRDWNHALATGTRLETANRIKRHDGAYRWHLSRNYPFKDPNTGEIIKWFGTSTDIHDQVEALAASRRSQSQLQSVIYHANVTIWAIDREGIITIAEGPGLRYLHLDAVNDPASSMLVDDDDESYQKSSVKKGSKEESKIIGRSIYEVWRLTDIRESIESALEGETVVAEMELDGRWYRTSLSPLRAQGRDVLPMHQDNDYVDGIESNEGQIIGVVGASLDITDKKQAQEDLERSIMEKTRALAAEGAAREASRLKSQFLANMSHEIRTPIAGIIGLTELLLDEKLSGSQAEYAETIQRSAEGLLTVINDVLDFSKVEIGKLDVEQVPFDVVILIKDIKNMLMFAARKKGLEFRETLNISHKGNLLGDLGRVRQVLTNLLSNAIKFTSVGRISLEVTQLPLPETNAVDNTVLLRFDIRDTGCGIEKEAQSRLFEPFSQADSSTARRFGGTGLGLSISKNLVKLMGGEIGLESTEGQGSHAWFAIPFRKATIETGVEESSSSSISGSSTAQVSKRAKIASPELEVNGGDHSLIPNNRLDLPREETWILVAEDNEVNARIASRNIEKMGFKCNTAEDGNVAVEELGRREYSLVLMDCQMPDCDGYEATRLIRKSVNKDIRSLPVIALTASAINGDRERALEAGMNDYLTKPVKRKELETILCKWLYDDDCRQTLSNFLSAASS